LKLLGFSDSHARHREIQNLVPADVLICAGDITFRGEAHILQDFADWMKELPYKNKICIFGNHEIMQGYRINREPAVRELFEESGITLLHNSSVVIDGIKFYGSPCTPEYGNYAWMYSRGKEAKEIWSKVPDDTGVLVTHGPPYGILDRVPCDSFSHENVGCKELRARIRELPKLKAWVGGHIHPSYGSMEEDGIKFYNVSVCNKAYDCTNPAQLIEI
jgi:Icc-related predicted phosphoesterase